MSVQNQEPYGESRLFSTNSEFSGQVSPKIEKNKRLGGCWFFLMSITAGWCRAQSYLWVQGGMEHLGAINPAVGTHLCLQQSESLLARSWERIPANRPCHYLCKLSVPSWLLLGRILGSSTSNLILMELLAAFIFLFLIVKLFWKMVVA